ncbi:MAG: alanine--tRNA ligase, partial [Ignavibacteriaceae bacterium]
FDEKDNFWEMGETGPCGPCSEIHINLTDDYDNPKYVNAGTPECIEIWNLVFIQYNRDENGKLHDLPSKHVDTGMGFERVCAVMQQKNSNYDTDVFMPLINRIAEISKVAYEEEEHKIPMRVIADHIRTLTFAIADGAVPGNDGRGYVLRRILRRASRYGRKLNMKEPFLFLLVDVLVETMSGVFPEIKEKQEYVKKIIKSEEESFNRTLDRGIELFETIVKDLKAKNETVIHGEDAFKLYDTFGFPIDLTNVMAREIGFRVDEQRFNELMNEQKRKSREDTKNKTTSYIYENYLTDRVKGKTEFVGYDYKNLVNFHVKECDPTGDEVYIFDKTPFYGESGGQVGDTGKIILKDGKEIKIINTLKRHDDIIHEIESLPHPTIEGASFSLIGDFNVSVDVERRWDIMRNHSATHLLHAAMRKILGTHVRQSGSYVGPDHLRFDFTHFEKVKESELEAIESLVNEQIRKNLVMIEQQKTLEEAKKMGALMFFGDKYGDIVRVIQFGDFSMEFCGGTHVKNSSQIGLFKILSESSIASGVRRIEAVTGAGVEKFILEQEIKSQKSEIRINELIEEKKKLEKELADLKLKEKLGGIDSIISNPTEAAGIKIFKGKVAASNMDELKSFGDELRNKIKSGVGLLASEIEGKVGLVCVVSDDLIKEKKLSAGKIVGETAKILGGAGGGRSHLATAGGKDVSKIDEALKQVDEIVKGF